MARNRYGFGHEWASRKNGRREVAKVVVVAYDGEATEASYFRGWKSELASSITLEPIYVRSGGNALSAVQAAVRVAKAKPEYDEFWCVCDIDDSSDRVVEQAKALAERSGIKLCLSRRSFEVWISLHYRRSDRAILTEAEAIALVRADYPEYSSKKKIVPFHILHPRTEKACENAQWLAGRGCGNPLTNVHELVIQLNEKYKQKKLRGKI